MPLVELLKIKNGLSLRTIERDQALAAMGFTGEQVESMCGQEEVGELKEPGPGIVKLSQSETWELRRALSQVKSDPATTPTADWLANY